MSQKKTKQLKKHTVKEVLKSLHWSVEGGKLQLLSTITDEFVSIELDTINNNQSGQTQQN